jgi:hypothetical protein
MPRYWKWLSKDGKSCNGGDYTWSLPTWDAESEAWVPGAWTHRINNVQTCCSGWHLCRDQDLREWIGGSCWVVEVAHGALVVQAGNKVVTSGPVRLVAGTAWDDRVARLFAASCALRALPIYESVYPDDPRVGDAIAAAVLYANGVAWAAAGAAAWAAAGDAAWAAVRDAAGAAARAAAWAAAGDAAWAAAGDAAGDAARAAAWDAARAAAWDAARGAAWDAAWDAARDAAWDAVWGAQSAMLVQYLDGGGDLM